MLIETQHTTFLQIVCEFLIDLEVIPNVMKCPDDTCDEDLQS